MSKLIETEIVSDEELHDIFCSRIFSISEDGYKYISKEALYDFFYRIDKISLDIKEIHQILLQSFITEDCIPINVKMAEIHMLCFAIYSMKEKGKHYKTIDHLTRVKEYTSNICLYLKINGKYKDFINDETIELIPIGAFLHDISKLIFDDKFLYKEDFNDEERLFMKSHPSISTLMISYMKEKNKHLDCLKEVIIYVDEHHENLDGSGYPKKKIGNQISFGGKTIRVSDSYEAMRSKKRTYQKSIGKKQAINEMLFKPNVYDEQIVIAAKISIRSKPKKKVLL